jgi:hypothetical protein
MTSALFTHKPVRPLAELSDYVMEQLPADLAGVRRQSLSLRRLEAKCLQLVRGLPGGTLAAALADPRTADVAALDLKMLETAVVNSGGRVPTTLSKAVSVCAAETDQPAVLTYEDLIFINPQCDERVFSLGPVAKSESDFYQTHREIEKLLASAIEHANLARQELLSPDASIQAVVSQVTRARSDIDEAAVYVERVGREMNPDHFTVFRSYLVGNSHRGLKGPSGAFTAGIPTMDLLIGGENLDSSCHQYLSSNLPYFPRDGRVGIKTAQEIVARGESLNHLCEVRGNPQELRSALDALVKSVRRFRGHHYTAVRRQIPSALSGTLAGTGGEGDVDGFLKGRIATRHLGRRENDVE